MKRVFLALFFLIIAISLPAQQAKRVYITLDVSGSMGGDKYALANYTTQMIVTLCDDDDEVSIIVTGKEYKFKKNSDPLQQLQYPFDALPLATGSDRDDEFNDIVAFNRIYKPSNNKQNWLFIIGDGDWSTYYDQYAKDRALFEEIVEKGTLNVCYLQTNVDVNKTWDFTQFVSTLGVVDIGRADNNPQTIMDGCNHFARKILGFSDVPLKVKKSGKKCISVNAELPVKAFYLVYQDAVKPTDLPIIEQVMANGTPLQSKLKGSPTTLPVTSSDVTVDLSGNVWRVDANSVIPANTEIEVCFDKEIDPSKVCIYPLVENVEFESSGLTLDGGKLKRLDSRSFIICRDEHKALVRIELDNASVSNLPEGLLKSSTVIVKANNKEYKAKYNNGGFECEIELIDQETQYYAECDCPGYFKRVTPIMTIKKGDCTPVAPKELQVVKGPTFDAGSMTFEQLKHDYIGFSIRDSLSNGVLDPELFDITFNIEHSFLYEEPKMRIEDDTLVMLELHPKGQWCECLYPKSLDINMISTPKEEAFDEYGKNYHKTEFTIHLDVVKDRSWIARCLWVIITIVALLLLFFYLRALQHKNRFKKYAMITPVYYDYYGRKIDDQGGTLLRKQGFGAWFARWFLPGDEKRTLSFESPYVSMVSFVAADSNDVVNVPKEGNIDPETMQIAGYNPKRDDKPKEPVKLANGGRITILKDVGVEEGYLVFSSGEKNDGHGYRIFLSLLKLASLVGVAFLVYLMVKSFF